MFVGFVSLDIDLVNIYFEKKKKERKCKCFGGVLVLFMEFDFSC